MARARNIKPSIFKNELLGEADPLLTILFQGLWCLADREGRLEDRPKRIKAEIFPYRDGIDADAMLDWLENNSFIDRYQIEDESYIQVEKFHVHQNPHHMEAESVIPPRLGDENKLKAKPLYKKQKQRILERDEHKCQKCQSTKKLHIDHIVPVSRGGTSDDENLQVLCEKCNTSKGNKIDDESLTNGGGIDKRASIPLIPDSGYLIPDSLDKPTPPHETKSKLDFSWWPETPDQQILKDWLAMRRGKKAPVSQTVINRYAKQLQLACNAGYSVNECLELATTKGWLDFKFEWFLKEEKNNGNSQRGGNYQSQSDRLAESARLAGIGPEVGENFVDGSFERIS